MSEKHYDILIVGGGVIGSAINYHLSKYNLNILQIEKNSYLADETSMGNSGVIHGGFDAEHPIEAKMNVEGNKLWRNEILPNITIPHAEVPSLVIACNDEEMSEVRKLYDRGIKNKLRPEDMEVIDAKRLKELEPNITDNAVGALLCTSSIAVDPVMATRGFVGAARQNGSTVRTTSELTAIVKDGEHFIATINGKEKIKAHYVINAAGHYADVVSHMAKESTYELKARRGEYRILSKTESSKVNNIVFKVPTIYGKGVVVATMLDGRVLVGPTAEEGIKKEDTRLVTREMYNHIGKIGHDMIPSLNLERTEKIYSGSRPIDYVSNDFIIDYGKDKNFIEVAATKSPALSGAPAIAIEVEKLLVGSGLKLDKKANWNPKYDVVW